MKNKAKGPLLIAATAILWSFAGLLIKVINDWDAMTIVGLRAAFAAAIMAIYMRKPRITFNLPVLLGGACMSATTMLFVYANKLTTSANAIVLQYTAPIFLIILTPVILKTRLKALDIAAVIVTFAGIALFFLDQLLNQGAVKSALLGNVLAILAGLTFAGLFITNRMPGAKPEESLLLGHLINVVVSLPFIFMHVTLRPESWIAISLLGVFQLGLAYVLFSIGVKTTPPITASLIAALEPLLNPIWVFLFWPTHERPGPWALVGGAIVIAAVVAYNILSARSARPAVQPGKSGDLSA